MPCDAHMANGRFFVIGALALAVVAAPLSWIAGQVSEDSQRTQDQRISRIETIVSERGERMKDLDSRVTTMEHYNDSLERSGLRGIGLQAQLTGFQDRMQLLMWIIGTLGAGTLTLGVKTLSVMKTTHGIINSRWSEQVIQTHDATALAKAASLIAAQLAHDQGREEGRAEAHPNTTHDEILTKT